MEFKSDGYKKALIDRLKKLMELSNLEIKGFSKLTGISENHIYSILSGRRTLTSVSADKIGKGLDFDGTLIFNLQIELPEQIKKSETLKKFIADNRNNTEYFIDSNKKKKLSTFIKQDILPTDLLKVPRYVWEINTFCESKGRKILSDTLKKHLSYLVVKGELKSKKRPIKKRDGSFGERMVDVFWK
jgi:plasmid maintenance system antidote protein VapI